jgi:hypothetical protein
VAWAFPGLERPVCWRRSPLPGDADAVADPVLRRSGFDALQEVLFLRGFVRRRHPYEELVNTERAEAAVRDVAASDSADAST